MVKRIASFICGSVMLFSAAGCSDIETASSGAESSSSAPDSSSAAAPEAESTAGRSYAPTTEIGDKLKKVCEIYDSGCYTLECTLTGTNISGETRITRVEKNGDLYQVQHERLGDFGTVTLSGRSYDFDYICGMYRERESAPVLNIIKQIEIQGVPRTNIHAPGEKAEYDTEQYTYTGDTYMTVLDFCFDKKDGHLIKYDTTYSVEGQDDIVETRTVTRLDTEADESVFNAYFTDTLVNFGTMTEEQRLGFCQGLFASYGIDTEDLSEFGVTSSGLGKIDYDTLASLVHTCGRLREQTGKDESSAEESLSEESLTNSESTSSEDSLTDESTDASSESDDTQAESTPEASEEQ